MKNEIAILVQKLPYANHIALTIGVMVVYQILKLIVYKKIDRTKFEDDADKILAKNKVRDYGRLVLLIALFSLWFSQLQTVFISLLAFAAAIVIAFKEVIMCMTGGMIIRINKQFSIGHRIEIDGIRGYVLDRAITATKVLELGPERNSQQTTGNIISIPNSIFLTKSVVNTSYFKDYSIRAFTFSPIRSDNVEESEYNLKEIADEICKDYVDEAELSIQRFCQKEGILIPTIKPRVKILLSEDNDVKLLLKMPVDNSKIGDIEQQVYREYLKLLLPKENSNV
ncbi:mechanosensitive ion channel family protein [Bacteriovoracaceae bacterium]|nr:mechanosensitive ion channel family protein [Bacteriovoracaceae bacterium]